MTAIRPSIHAALWHNRPMTVMSRLQSNNHVPPPPPRPLEEPRPPHVGDGARGFGGGDGVGGWRAVLGTARLQADARRALSGADGAGTGVPRRAGRGGLPDGWTRGSSPAGASCRPRCGASSSASASSGSPSPRSMAASPSRRSPAAPSSASSPRARSRCRPSSSSPTRWDPPSSSSPMARTSSAGTTSPAWPAARRSPASP